MRIRFEVSLESTGEIDFKALTATLQPPAPPQMEEHHAAEHKQCDENDGDPNVVDLTEDDPVVPAHRGPAAAAAADPVDPVPPAPLASGPQTTRGRFNIIEHLEQRYGKGGVLDIKSKPASRKQADADDLYDSDDSFIDDSDLHESIENTYFQTQVKTKHSGFFVNAGENIETVKDATKAAADEPEDAIESENESPKKKGKRSLHEDMYMDDDWQPGPEVDAVVSKLKQTAADFFSHTPAPKMWPPALDEGLREVDKLVVSTHPQRWRVNGYMANLMTFLPYTKTMLRARMVMLEARDNASEAKQKIDEHLVTLQTHMAPHATKLESGEWTSDIAKEAIMADLQIAIAIYMSLTALDDWVTKENEYRPLLKQEDKKLLEEADTIVLSTQKERNRLYSKILTSLPPRLNGTIDLAGLRELFKIGRKGCGHKANTPHTTPVTKKAGAASAKKTVTKTPKTPKTKESPAGSAASTTAPSTDKPPPTKKAAKPLKSRRFETCPIWSASDFVDAKS
ncbi:Aste57867_10243 [Aphanomyces stellatus]|uniref:Aste57867_10243 protein n=1 Tax=Aphanomyces stellatus TaxID=120398 RepID=A0A485KQD0_9STRA|nr:hypothetical protein As57867_010204 [Aphanomyces stellatus]VFT87118.1 Aste57867_10243 [Aphanomyces stellatus]